MTDLIWSFSPWAAFLLVNRFASIDDAVGAALAVTVVIIGRAIARKKIHMLELVSAVFFAAAAVVLYAFHPGHLDDWARYAQAVAHGTLTIVVFGSILAGHPFTQSYAREQTPEAFWHSPIFHAFNKKASTVFGFAFLLGTISMILAGATDHRQVILRLVVPFGALFLAYTYVAKAAASLGAASQSVPQAA